jgi:4-hydroxy-tetrahydrodipicolinate synthase
LNSSRKGNISGKGKGSGSNDSAIGAAAQAKGTISGNGKNSCIKDSAGDFVNMQALVREFPGLAVLAGADPLMLPLLREGGAGCITATSNLVAAELAFVFCHFADPAKAAEVEAAQARIVAARNQASRFAQMASLKVMLGAKLSDPAWSRLRPPLLPLTPEETAALLAN